MEVIDFIMDRSGCVITILIALCIGVLYMAAKSEKSHYQKRVDACSTIHKDEKDDERRKALIFLCADGEKKQTNTVVVPIPMNMGR